MLLQSAMEYLMTYGWAILAIAVIMVSLYSLGIFNLSSFGPKATAGSCQVVKTATQISLAGQCNGYPPKYVMAPVYYNPPQYVFVNYNFPKMTAFTQVGWTYYSTGTQSGFALVEQASCGIFGPGWSFDSCNCRFSSNDVAVGCGGSQVPSASKNRWQMVASSVYANGTVVTYSFTAGTESKAADVYGSQIYVPAGAVYMGSWQGSGSYTMNGIISNIQIYNTTLDESALKALYNEGVGGAPVDVQHLIGWWPLNGNANDYSSNYRNGQTTNTIWLSSYTAT
ncbi:MAG: hypothetical protein KGH69_00100 [Candidatus Micrarchaeota archaeon]|nr:hypothetical protein [Candidatus Micrarchaeota archaeon]